MHTRDSVTPVTQGANRAKLGRPARIAQPVEHHVRPDNGDAFIPDPGSGPAVTRDSLAEFVAEEFLASATAGNEMMEDDRDQFRAEELGGPFIQSGAEDEFATGTDEANPSDATREPFPTANHARK